MNRHLRRAAALIALLSVGVLTTGIPARAAPGQARPHAGGTLTVFAAASLKEVFTAMGAQFDKQNGSKTTFNFGGSDTLATQIIQGAPADVFASANTAQMTVVANKGLIATPPTVFVRNRLVVIVPRSNPGHIYSLPDLGRPGVRLVMEAPSVPAGKYGRAAFQVMANDAAFGPDFLARIQKNTVSEETDVKAVVTKIALGEGDAGVVYVTDARVAPRVQTIAIPPAYNQIATYPIAVVKGSQNATLAQKFVDYVLSSAGQTALKNAGFITGSATPKGGYSPTIQITGLVSKTLTLGVSDLKKMPATTVTATQRTQTKVLGAHTYTGVLLNDVIQAAIPISNTSFKNDPLRMFVTVHATDNYQVTVALAEILPAFGHQQILLAYAQDGKPLAHSDGAVELIVPGDTLAGRDVRNVDEIVVGTPLGNI